MTRGGEWEDELEMESVIDVRPEVNYIHHSSSPTILPQSCLSMKPVDFNQTMRSGLFLQRKVVFWILTAQMQSPASKEVSNYNYRRRD